MTDTQPAPDSLLRRPDSWFSRDYPVLLAAAEHLAQSDGRPVSPVDLSVDALSQDDVTRAVARLIDTGHLGGEVRRGFGGIIVRIVVYTLTEKGLRVTGEWPGQDQGLQALVDAMSAAAEHASDPEERSRLRRIAEECGRVGRDVGVEILTAVAKSMVGLPGWQDARLPPSRPVRPCRGGMVDVLRGRTAVVTRESRGNRSGGGPRRWVP